MKTFLKNSFALLIVFLLIQPVYGQRILRDIRNKVQERVEKKVEEKAEEKVDEAIDKQLDKLEEAIEEEAGEDSENKPTREEKDAERAQRMQNILKGMGMSGEPVPIADNYQFRNRIQMHIESYDKNGNKESEGEFITHFDPEAHSMAYEMISGDVGNTGQGLFILDATNGAAIILSDENGEKTGIVYGMGSFFESMGQSWEEEADLDETPESYLSNPNVEKTGRTKTIAGYKCEEYKYSDEESESNIWITKDLKLNTRDFFSTLFQTSLYSHGIPWGYMMEVNTIEKDSGEKSIMQVTDVDENSNKRFALNEYQITNLGAINFSSGEEESETE
ncbi:MAG: DUF4412 domain-containing protein [Bacteroidota bacterium]